MTKDNWLGFNTRNANMVNIVKTPYRSYEFSVHICFSHKPRWGQLLRQKHRNNFTWIYVQFFFFFCSSKQSQSVSLIYELARVAVILKSWKNWLKLHVRTCPCDWSCPHILMMSRQSKTIGMCAWTLIRR